MYGLIGYPLGHSFSEKYFRNKFAELRIEETYRLFPLKDISELPALLESNPGIRGLNVTIPYKEAVIPYLDRLSADATEIGAVNCIRIIQDADGRRVLTGHNTDWDGFAESLRPHIRPEFTDALVLGSGGASKAVAYALKALGISPHIVSRTRGKGEFVYEDLSRDMLKRCPLVVNTTPLGMSPDIHSAPPLPYHLLNKHNFCYDLVYNPELTEFLRRAESHDAEIKNGLEMLHLQADISWKIWNAP